MAFESGLDLAEAMCYAAGVYDSRDLSAAPKVCFTVRVDNTGEVAAYGVLDWQRTECRMNRLRSAVIVQSWFGPLDIVWTEGYEAEMSMDSSRYVAGYSRYDVGVDVIRVIGTLY